MKGKQRYIGLTVALGLGLAFVLLWSLSAQRLAAQAVPGTRYVALDGDDGDQCDSIANRCRTVQRAIDAADTGDEIRVAAGTYTAATGTVATLTKTVTLLGGWDSSFSTRDPSGYPTTLDAQGNGRVVTIHGDITPTMDGLVITGGDATSETLSAGLGGGIFADFASPILQNNVIISNVAAAGPTCGHGGGLYISRASASTWISGNQVLSNTACITGLGNGGGLFLWQSDANVVGNLIQGNTGSRYGGGVNVMYGAATFLDNEIRANVAGRNGGGIYLGYASSLIQGNLMVGNIAGWDGLHWNGGALLATYGSPTIRANRILSNSAGSSAGLGLETGDYFTVTNNLIAHNNVDGVMLWELTRYGLVAHNTIVGNGGASGIRLAYAYITPTIVNNIVALNATGISAHANASGTLDYNDVWGNTLSDYDLPGALEPGPHDLHADPLFVSPAGEDYHLRSGSPCVDAGTDVGVATDMDGDRRPMGIGYDIGADEQWVYVHLPLVNNSHAP